MRIASAILAGLLLTTAGVCAAPSASPAPSAPGDAAPGTPYPGDSATYDQFDAILTNDCGATAASGRQLSQSWQQQVLAKAATKLVQDLIDFRQNAAMCLVHIGDLINADAPYASDLTSSISGTWNFSTDLWSSTNQFAEALSATPAVPPVQLVAAATPQEQKFSAAVDEFVKWINATKAHIADLRHQSSTD